MEMLRKDAQLGDKRRASLLKTLKESDKPVKAAQLAQMYGVSRQVIVQDMTLLRAKDEPLMATPQGYVYLASATSGVRQVILSRHVPSETENELNIMVDYGITVVDVGVEHSVYGNIFRPLGLKSRVDVKRFLQQMQDNEANLLCSLTGGLHMHTLEAPNQQMMDEVCAELARQGFLVGKMEIQVK